MTDVDTWKKRLLPASFRGIPFGVEDHEFSGGRSKVQHEPPDRDSTSSEDMGKKADGFSIVGHVIGDTYSLTRDALKNALERGGSGILVHPWLGILEVQPGEFSFRESMTGEGRIAVFSMEFSEAGDPSFPIAIIDAVTDFFANVAGAIAGIQNAFQTAYSISLLPGFAVESSEAIAEDFKSGVGESIDKISGKEENTAELRAKLGDFDSNELVRNPASMAAAIDDILDSLKDVPEDAAEDSTIDITKGRDEKIDVFTDLVNFAPDTIDYIPDTTDTRERELANALALRNLVRQIAIVRMAENAVVKEFDSKESALALREEIIDAINIQQKEDIDDDLFQILADLKTRITKTLPPDHLSTIETVTVNGTQPAIMIAYDLYGLPDNETDIIERNATENPAFISGEIEVLGG